MAARKAKRMAAGQPGFLSLKPSSDFDDLTGGRKKRVNKNKKKNWNKHSDIQDVEEFLDDVRLQERATGGLISERSDESLFFLDVGEQKKPAQKEPEKGKNGKAVKPLRIDLILQHDSLVLAPKDVLAYQQPNAKKLRRKAEKQVALAKLPRTQKRLLKRKTATATPWTKKQPMTNTHPERPFFDLWGAEAENTADPYFLEQTGKKLVKRPAKMNVKPSVLPAVEVIAPGGSYNPDFFSHQALLLEAHEVEVKKLKEEQRVDRQLAVNRDDTATEETVFQEQVEGLMEEQEEEEESGEEDDVPIGAMLQQEKKTEKQRRKERIERIKEQQRLMLRTSSDRRQQLFQLRSIHASLKQREQRTRLRQQQRRAKQEAQKALPRRLGRLRFQPQDLEVQLSDEIPGSLRRLKPEGSVLKDRFKSMQKRNLIEPRERAKFKRRHKVKYVEKRAFKEIT